MRSYQLLRAYTNLSANPMSAPDTTEIHETMTPEGEVDFVDPEAAAEPESEGPAKPPRFKLAWIAIPIALLAIAYGYRVWQYGSTHVATDDAYVTNDVVQVNARVAGSVQQILVSDNQPVEQGDLLVKLDDATYRSQVAEAEANLAVAKAAAHAAGIDVSIVKETGAGQIAEARGALDVESRNVAASEAAAEQSAAAISAAQSAVEQSQADAAAAAETVVAREAAVRGAAQSIEASKALVSSAEAAEKAAEANLGSAEASARNATSEADRARGLFAAGAISKSLLDSRVAAGEMSQGALLAARQQVLAAHANVIQRRADAAAMAEQANQAKAAVSQARAMATAASRVVATRRAQALQAVTAARASTESVGAAEARARQAEGRLRTSLTAPAQTSASQAGRASALARVRQAMAALAEARLALDRTEVRAPIAGFVTRRSAQLGQQISTGQPLMVLIPSERPWIVANFKETQFAQIRPGEAAEIQVDALPGEHYRGRVDSISSGTGSTFALLPPDNASGNFTKVVQRIPVKIVLDDQPHLDRLRSGLSSNVSISVGR